jgi:hypothetical protein
MAAFVRAVIVLLNLFLLQNGIFKFVEKCGGMQF